MAKHLDGGWKKNEKISRVSSSSSTPLQVDISSDSAEEAPASDSFL